MDYTLYPINNHDVDWPLYHLVAHFMKNSYHLDGITVGDGQTELFKPFDDDAVQEKRSYEYKLVFPNEELTVSYPEEILDQEVVVLKSYIPIEHVGIPNAFDPDDDGVWYQDIPLEYFCFSRAGSDLVLKHVRTQVPSQFPDCVYNGLLFAQAIERLVDFLRRHHLTELPWFERFQTVLQMLEGNANELHILHNAGFYDHNSLWSWLEDYGIPKRDLENHKDDYLAQLKRYAMFVLNQLNWESGTPVGEKDRENRVGLYHRPTDEDIAAANHEMSRRMKLLRSKLEQAQAKASGQNTYAVEQEPLGQLSRNDHSNNRMFLMIIGAFTVLVLIVFGLVAAFGSTAAIAVGGIVAIVTAGVASAAARSYQHRHPAGFRYVLLFVGIIFPFLLGWMGNKLMYALKDDVSPQALMVFVLLLMTVVIVASAMLRLKQPDERHARPYTVAIVVAVMEIIGHFVGGFIYYVK